MVRIGRMASPPATPEFSLTRRNLIAALGAAALCPALPATGAAQGRTAVALQARPDRISLRPGDGPGPGRPGPSGPETPVWSLGSGELRFKRGEVLDVTFGNDLPVAAALDCRGLDGVAAAEPLASRALLGAGAKDSFQLPLRHAGTFLCEPLLGDGGTAPARPRPLIVTGTSPVAVDRDEVLLIEEWRLQPDGSAIPAGNDPKDSTQIHTINGKTSYDISAPANARLRLRFINGSQRSVLAVKLENLDVRVMAIDGQPAEPFPARNGALVLAPGSRTDVFVDAAGPAGTSFPILLHDGKQARPVGRLAVSNDPPVRPAPFPPAPPLPGNDMPAQLDLKSAARFELTLGTPTEWFRPADFKPSTAPAFQAKAGRPVVLALTNRGPIASVFHLHGHHFRLLDRLDDGWKPFWLDTLAIEPGQTQRIAFLAEYPGRYLIEQVATDWAGPRLVRWYSVQ
ncbi:MULTISPECIES: multicopper oxidase family protein [Bradyrhizobium]|jgi:FtsP/CotA-like multicopper oxidase with cupredoxin domain|nr:MULTISPECIES: multicopper oxidase domain-containing protein [Bradyrhizobium]MDI2057249.1 multicopper oxidase domain-containing protein [Bradyrhizobium sp. Mp19]MDI2104003.1 multicopper oxidase domain-containing protein [Bradyrhizobium sp. Mp64]WLB04817.1 multicopper oxidase domain-containing protein [Bradyrhizobium elkanii]WLC12251.1 multicopper oxidase domain-containing protein [Bradyrhizobium elkanii USDA 94]